MAPARNTVIEFGVDHVKVNGREFTTDNYPRAQMPGLRAHTITQDSAGTSFDFEKIVTKGDLRRVDAHLVFGACPAK